MSIYLLSDTFHEGVVNLPQIKVICRDIELDLTPYDALIFSSKNAVKAIEKINKVWRKIPSYAIGEPTAKSITKLNGNLVFTSNSSYGDDFAQEIYPKLKGKKVLFLRAKKVLSNLENILKEAGADLSTVIKATLFLDNMDNFTIVNEIYATYFKDHKPARSTVAVKTLPKNALIEVEVIAIKK